MQGVSSTGSTLLGLLVPKTRVLSSAMITVTEAPKVVYHIYDIRYNGKISLKYTKHNK